MENTDVQDVLNLLIESWEEFKKYYIDEKERYSERQNEAEHFVCWKEDDIVLQLSRFFYKKLDASPLAGKGIEIHTQMKISENTFKKEYDFHKNLPNLIKKLGKVPTPDFIITKEDFTPNLWLIGEVKYVRTKNYFSLDRITDDIKKLNTFKDLGICSKTVYLVSDDGSLHEKSKKILEEPKIWRGLKDMLKEAQNSTSANKIDYLDLMLMCKNQNDDCWKHNNFDFKAFCNSGADMRPS